MLLAPMWSIQSNDEPGEVITVQVLSMAELDASTPVDELPPPPETVEEIIPEAPPEPEVIEDEIPIEIEPLPEEEPTETPEEDTEPEIEPEKTVVEAPVETTPRVPRDTGPKEIRSPATAGGSAFAGATVETFGNVDFEYSYWFTQAFNKINRNWRRPNIISDAGIVCVVYFKVIKSGKIVDAEVRSSSSVPQMDQSCLQAVQRAAPLPPLPRRFADEVIGISIPFKLGPG